MKSRGSEGDVWFLLSHGAGAPSTSPWMQHYAELLSRFGPVRPFDYPYMVAGKKRPDHATKLISAHREALEEGKKALGPKAVLAGKSMGGRIGCHLALEEEVLGVVCFGYPLLGMGKSSAMRDQVLYDLKAPACFIQGTRDRLCPLDQMKEVLQKRSGPSHLHIVETGDHSLEPTKTHLKNTGLSKEALEEETMGAVAAFLEEIL